MKKKIKLSGEAVVIVEPKKEDVKDDKKDR